MEQLTLEGLLKDNKDKVTPISQNESEELEIVDYTPEQLDILDLLNEMIADTMDPKCPLKIYLTNRSFYKLTYSNGSSNYFYLTQKAVERKIAKEDVVESTKVEEKDVPKSSKVLSNRAQLFSFNIDQSLSIPKWFSISYLKTITHIFIVISQKDIENRFKSILDNATYSYDDGVLTVDTSNKHVDIIDTLKMLTPVLKHRFNFLYNHRLVEQCCCGLQTDCIKANQCVSVYREMQMKCSFRKYKERVGDFTKGPISTEGDK